MNKTTILGVVSRKLSPFVVLFGFYLVSFGHLTPGGGFQGGVVIASGVILLLLGKEDGKSIGMVNVRVAGLIEAGSLLAFLMIGIIGAVVGGAFLRVLEPVGSGGRVQDAPFILVLNMVIGMKVGAGVTVICYRLFTET